ncbi:MAG: class I SAM-dependent methyltransferase [Saprospiraceae bacterium]|nr:class I SAM-dependent methyltransferase [Saprospiraceae bacterium]
MLDHIEIPNHFIRNSSNVTALGAEETGLQLINLAMSEIGIQSLKHVDILDVGCGVRFTQTLINRKVSIGSYTGIEVFRPIVDFLRENVEREDKRFHFVHCDIHNDLYNPTGQIFLPQLNRLPVEGKYDLIWLFSVFTHLNASDAGAMLQLLRDLIRPSGSLFFSSFIDQNLTGFEDRQPDNPLLNAYFGFETMIKLIRQAGWEVRRFQKRDFKLPIVDYFVCSPVEND